MCVLAEGGEGCHRDNAREGESNSDTVCGWKKCVSRLKIIS